MNKRGVGGREVTVSFRGNIIKIASRRKNERDLTIYTEQIPDLQKLIFNIRIRREVRNIAVDLNISRVHIYPKLLANVVNSILQILIADTVRYA